MTEAETTPSLQGSPFWRFSLQFYRQPGVAEACIALQEQSGVDVNLLMYLLWQASQRSAFSTDDVAWLESKISGWRESAVVPLRAVRRALKDASTLVPAGNAEAFRTKVKGIELEAERLQQQAMYELAVPVSFGTEAATSDAAARASVAAYASMLARPFSKAVVDALLTAFAEIPKSP